MPPATKKRRTDTLVQKLLRKSPAVQRFLDRPVLPLSAVQVYAATQQHRRLKNVPQNYDRLRPSDKIPFEQIAALDVKRYHRELKGFTEHYALLSVQDSFECLRQKQQKVFHYAMARTMLFEALERFHTSSDRKTLRVCFSEISQHFASIPIHLFEESELVFLIESVLLRWNLLHGDYLFSRVLFFIRTVLQRSECAFVEQLQVWLNTFLTMPGYPSDYVHYLYDKREIFCFRRYFCVTPGKLASRLFDFVLRRFRQVAANLLQLLCRKTGVPMDVLLLGVCRDFLDWDITETETVPLPVVIALGDLKSPRNAAMRET